MHKATGFQERLPHPKKGIMKINFKINGDNTDRGCKRLNILV
jgi:hypothetical protein